MKLISRKINIVCLTAFYLLSFTAINGQPAISLKNSSYTYLKSKLPENVKMMGVVKAFGYGSDACEVALFLETLGVNYFAVAYAYEGVALRNAGVQTPILVLHPQPDNFGSIIEHHLEPNLYSARVFREFCAFAKAYIASSVI